jgi:hypothetical protein
MMRADRYLIGTEDPNLDPACIIPAFGRMRQLEPARVQPQN